MRESILLLALLAPFVATNARGQPAGASSGEARVSVPGCYVLTAYGVVPTCMVSLSPSELSDLQGREAAYRTDGARVTAAPTAGAGAAYFHNAAQALAAPSTSWVRTVDPELGAGSFASDQVAAVQLATATATASAPPPPSAPPPAAAPKAQPSTSASSARAAPLPEQVARWMAAMDAGAAGSTALGTGLERTTLDEPAGAFPTPTRARGSSRQEATLGPVDLSPVVLWVVAGTPFAALLVFVAVRALASRVRGS